MTAALDRPVASGLPPELRRLATWVGKPVRRTVTVESVRRFAAAVDPRGDGTSQARRDPEVAPPTYFCPDPLVVAAETGLRRPAEPPRSIDGGTRWEFGEPVRVGDVVTLLARVGGVTQRRTGDGRTLVETTVEVQGWNQRGRSVGRAIGTIVNYESRRP
jgi:hypothetical protein